MSKIKLKAKQLDYLTTLIPIIGVVVEALLKASNAQDMSLHDAIMWLAMAGLGFFTNRKED